MRLGLYKLVMSVFIIFYIGTAVASHNRKSDFWGAYYKKFRWMQTTMCFWQNWGMFAPPPGSTSWLVLQGKTAEGEIIELEPLYAPVEKPYWRWRYDRLQKLALSSFQKSRKPLRNGIARYACDRAEQAGTPLKSIIMTRDRTWAVRPSKRWKDADYKGRHKVEELGEIKCR